MFLLRLTVILTRSLHFVSLCSYSSLRCCLFIFIVDDDAFGDIWLLLMWMMLIMKYILYLLFWPFWDLDHSGQEHVSESVGTGAHAIGACCTPLCNSSPSFYFLHISNTNCELLCPSTCGI